MKHDWRYPPELWHPETKAQHSGFNPFYSMGAVRPPIFNASTYATESAADLENMFARAYGKVPPFAPNDEWPIYTRVSNPNFIMLCERLQFLEQGSTNRAEYFPSGLSAIFCTVLALCKPDDVLIYGVPLYGGTDHQFRALIPEKLKVDAIGIDATDLNEVENALKKYSKRVRIVFIETPANPSLAMVDIEEVAKLTHELTGAVVVVDNTFMSPILQHPFEFGSDIVVYSGTKSIGGHSDLIAGFVVDRDIERAGTIHGTRVITGPVPSAFDAWLIYRSLDTLEVRVKQTQENAKIVAGFLSNHPKVERVIFPELFKNPSEQYRIYKKQCLGPGSMITFEPKGGKTESFKLLDNLEVFALAVSLGGVESLAENPWFHTHSDVTDERKKKCGFTESSIRLSIGLEHPDDLCADLEQALLTI